MQSNKHANPQHQLNASPEKSLFEIRSAQRDVCVTSEKAKSPCVANPTNKVTPRCCSCCGSYLSNVVVAYANGFCCLQLLQTFKKPKSIFGQYFSIASAAFTFL